MTLANPNVAIHLTVLYSAACHACGWESELTPYLNVADDAADTHDCGML